MVTSAVSTGASPPCGSVFTPAAPPDAGRQVPVLGWRSRASGQSLAKVAWPVRAEPVVTSALYPPTRGFPVPTAQLLTAVSPSGASETKASPPPPQLLTAPPAPFVPACAHRTLSLRSPPGWRRLPVSPKPCWHPAAAPRPLVAPALPPFPPPATVWAQGLPLSPRSPAPPHPGCLYWLLAACVAPSLLAGDSPTSLAFQSLTSDLPGHKDLCLCLHWDTPELWLPSGFIPEFLPGHDPFSVSLPATNPAP